MTVTEYFSEMSDYRKDAQLIGEQLTQLAREGHSTAADIVAAARPKNAPLHPFFEWDDKGAADQWRLIQARNMVQHIFVRVADSRTGETRTMRAFHAVTIGPAKTSPFERGMKAYVTLSQVRQRPDFRTQVLGEAKRQLLSWRERYAEYEDAFAPVFAAVDQLDAEKVQAA